MLARLAVPYKASQAGDDLSVSDKKQRLGTAAYIFGALLGVALIVAILRLPVILIVARAHMYQRSFPEVSQLPQPLSDTSVAQAKGISVSAFGWEFEAPWQRVSNTRKLKLIETTSFEGGQGVGFVNPRESFSAVGLVLQSKSKEKEMQSEFEAEFGADATTSGYDFENTVLNTRVKDVSLFMSYKRAQRNWRLLFLKSMDLSDAKSGFFSFSFGNLHGFQMGDPAKTRDVAIHGFDPQGHRVELFIGINGQTNRLQQSEINRILKTLHYVSTPRQP
jgi:hypothetical protein